MGKENTQKIESKHINLRTRIKRLVRRTICFSKTERMHDLVIGCLSIGMSLGCPSDTKSTDLKHLRDSVIRLHCAYLERRLPCRAEPVPFPMVDHC